MKYINITINFTQNILFLLLSIDMLFLLQHRRTTINNMVFNFMRKQHYHVSSYHTPSTKYFISWMISTMKPINFLSVLFFSGILFFTKCRRRYCEETTLWNYILEIMLTFLIWGACVSYLRKRRRRNILNLLTVCFFCIW